MYLALFRSAGVFGKSAFAGSKDRIARLEARDPRAGGFHDSGDIRSKARRFGLADTCEQADESGCASKEVPIIRINRGGADADEHLVCAGQGLLDVGVFEYVGRAVAMVEDGVRVHLLSILFGNHTRGGSWGQCRGMPVQFWMTVWSCQRVTRRFITHRD